MIVNFDKFILFCNEYREQDPKRLFEMTTQHRAIGALACGLVTYGVLTIGERMVKCEKQQQKEQQQNQQNQPYTQFPTGPQPLDQLLATVMQGFQGVRHSDWSTDDQGPLIPEERSSSIESTDSGTGTGTFSSSMDTSADSTSKVDVVTAAETAAALDDQ